MGNAFKLKEERFRKHKEEKFYTEGGETQAVVAQRGRGCLSLETFRTRLERALSYLI